MAGPHFPLGTAPRKVLQYDAVNSEVDFVVDLVPVTCGPEKGKTLWDVYAYTKANCIFSVQPLLTTWIQNSGFCGTYCSHTPHSMHFLFGIHEGVWRVKSTRALKGLSLWGHCLFGFPSLLHGPTRVGTALLPSDAAEWGGQRSFLVGRKFSAKAAVFFWGA